MEATRVLHINSEYRDSKVHSELTRRLDSKGLYQSVYCFFRGKQFVGKNQFEGNNVTFIYADILSPIDRYLFGYKGWKIYKHLKKTVDVKSFNLSHAATLFSNGYVAYKLFKEYGIPYIIAVRSTDLMYYRVAPFMANTGLKIMRNASQIVFISASLLDRFKKIKAVQPYLGELEHKFVLQPNGINEYWLNNINNDSTFKHKIIYVGNFAKRKNVVPLIKAIEQLRKEPGYEDTTLTIIGGQKDKNGEVLNVVKSTDFVSFLGVIKDKHQLLEEYRAHSIFAMPSLFETFGLVYIEALTQDLAVLYSKNYGIDGMLPTTAGEPADPNSVGDIFKKLKMIFDNRQYYSNKDMIFSHYDWDFISDNYIRIYNAVLNN